MLAIHRIADKQTITAYENYQACVQFLCDVHIRAGRTALRLRQNSVPDPVVRFREADTNATWNGDPGRLIIGREGPTNQPLAVFFAIGGTATNGVEYKQVSSPVTIPAGAWRRPSR